MSEIFDFSKIKVEKVVVGSNGEYDLFGPCVLSIEPPTKGMPCWRIRYDQGEGVKVLYAASTSVKIEAAEIIQEQQEQTIREEDVHE